MNNNLLYTVGRQTTFRIEFTPCRTTFTCRIRGIIAVPLVIGNVFKITNQKILLR